MDEDVVVNAMVATAADEDGVWATDKHIADDDGTTGAVV